MLLQATDDLAQRAFACFRRGRAGIATGHLPGGAHAVIVVGNDRDVHGAAAARGRAQLRQNQRLERRFCLRQLLGFCPRRLVSHDPLLKRAAATFERERILLRLPRAAHAVRSPPPQGGGSRPSVLMAPISEPDRSQNLGGARRGAGSRFFGMGSKPSRCACFLAALRARRMASDFSRVLRSDGFSYALRRFISRKTPSRCIFFLSTLRACSTLLSRTMTCKMFPICCRRRTRWQAVDEGVAVSAFSDFPPPACRGC